MYIYNLIAFPEEYVNAWERYFDLNESVKNMSDSEREEFNKKFDPHKYHTSMTLGKAYRGSFLDLDALIKIIESQDDPHGICEGYYNYLLIEKHTEGVVDGLAWGEPDSEIWYKAEYTDGKFRYVRIEKPRGFTGTVSFT